VWAWLRYREGLPVNKKRVYRLMHEVGLTVKRVSHAATRTPKAKPQAARPFPQSLRAAGLKLVSDNGSQPTATGFMAALNTSGIDQVFTSYHNPTGNAETEGLMRTIKEELLWLREFTSLEEAREVIRHWITVELRRALRAFEPALPEPL
jgi:transposase InsO family protein